MNFIQLTTAVVCLMTAASLSAQNSISKVRAVSLYELSHKPLKQARHFFNQGTVELRRGNYVRGLALLQKALSSDPDYWNAQNNLGFAFLQLGQPEKAESAFRRAIEIDPHNPIAYANLSITAVHRHNYSLAQTFASDALRIDPLLTDAKAVLGLAMVSSGDWTPEARRLLEETRSVKASETLLQKWPEPGSPGPKVNVVVGAIPDHLAP